MARLRVTPTEIVVRLHWVERLLAPYWRAAPRAPRAAITRVRAVTPTQGTVEQLVDVPLALNLGIPFRLYTTLPRVRTPDGHPAFVATFRFRPAVVVELDPEQAPWARWVVSDRDFDALVRELAPDARR